MRRIEIISESWPIAGAFTISRGSRTAARVLIVTIEENGFIGRGECVPYPRYGESVEGVTAQIEAETYAIRNGATRNDLLTLLPAGAARNAIDCALWDLEAKSAGKRAWALAGLAGPRPVVTAYTLSLDTPEAMEKAARRASGRPLLKVKLGGDGDADRIAAVRRGAPNATLIADANEAWNESNLDENLAACRAVEVKLVEQPLPAKDDDVLHRSGAFLRYGILICADESVHTTADLESVAEAYQAVNIKLDKAGGLTEALQIQRRARELNLQIMVGCMVGTSLAMAPAQLLTGQANFVDLDGPLLLVKDRLPGLDFTGNMIHPPSIDLWG